VFEQSLAIAIRSTSGVQAVTERVLQIMHAQLGKSHGRWLFLELSPFFGCSLPGEPPRLLQHSLHRLPANKVAKRDWGRVSDPTMPH
jgi:hypothetical protein